MNRNENLNKAIKAKNDCFFTMYEDIEKELSNYTDQLKGQIVYCPCDDWKVSNFTKYFVDHFGELGIKHLTATSYNPDGKSFRFDYDGISQTIQPMNGNGDFRSDETTAIKDACDIVITNEPFSLCRDFVYWLEGGEFELRKGTYVRR